MDFTRSKSDNVDLSRHNWALVTMLRMPDPMVCIDGVFDRLQDATSVHEALTKENHPFAREMTIVPLYKPTLVPLSKSLVETDENESKVHNVLLKWTRLDSSPFDREPEQKQDSKDAQEKGVVIRELKVDFRRFERIIADGGAEPLQNVALVHIISHLPNGVSICSTGPNGEQEPVLVLAGTFASTATCRAYCRDYFDHGTPDKPDAVMVPMRKFFRASYCRRDHNDVMVGGSGIGILEYIDKASEARRNEPPARLF